MDQLDKTNLTINQWEAFCDEIKASGREFLEAGRSMDTVSQADGLRYLGRLARGGIEKFVEYGDPEDPVIYKIYHEKIKWGFDNPDSIYNICTIDGKLDYVLTANRGTVNYFNVSTMEMGTQAKARITGFINDTDLDYDDNGNFSLTISSRDNPNPGSGNWLKMGPESTMLMIRQTFNDRSKEREVEPAMSCISAPQGYGELKVGKVVEDFKKAASFFTNTGRTFLDLTNHLMQNINTMPAADPDYMASMGADPNYAYFWSAFHAEPGQALLIHLPKIPECEAWSLCLHNNWLESLDFHKATIILNKNTAKTNPDGSVTMAVSMDDPGIDNWLNSCGHPWGTMMFRWTRAKEVVAPQTELVNLADVDMASKLKIW